MKLLAAVLPSVRRLVPTGHAPVTVVFAALLVGLELFGRAAAATDWQDGLAAIALLGGIGLVAARHRRQPVPWVGWLARRAGQVAGAVDRAWFEIGQDFRGTPPLPARVPPAVWGLLAGSLTWGVLAAALWAAFPDGWRGPAARASYLLYLVVLIAVWAGLMAVTFVGLLAVVRVFGDQLRAIVRPGDRRGLELALVAGYVLTVSAVGYFVPVAAVLGLCGVVAAGTLALAARAGRDGGPGLLWRNGAGRPVYAIPQWRLVLGGVGLAAVDVAALLVTACGGRLLTPVAADDPMYVTATLGTVAAWTLPGLVAAGGALLLAVWRTDPARRTPPTVTLWGVGRPDGELKRAAAVIAGWGWTARIAPGKPPAGQVGIELVADADSQATEFDPRWPLKVSLADLHAGAVRDRLARRDEIQVRRQAVRGVETLFKRAVADRTRRGGGYVFAPHWWFQAGLERHEPDAGRPDATPPKLAGPPFGWVFPARVRQHFHQVFRAVQVDIVYIEDGVSHRSVVKVLRALFELYDVHAGRKKADDHFFQGIPKVKVMVHEYAPAGRRFRVTGYKEPKFDELTRARVLHIFPDHGGSEVDVDVPFDFSTEPSPALGIG
ncbi:MAG: hypothetical protein U0871_22675 [Gemmataceae bacterium]